MAPKRSRPSSRSATAKIPWPKCGSATPAERSGARHALAFPVSARPRRDRHPAAAAPAAVPAAHARGGKRKGRGSGAAPRARKPSADKVEAATRAFNNEGSSAEFNNDWATAICSRSAQKYIKDFFQMRQRTNQTERQPRMEVDLIN
jgi:hypothetical protein